MAGYGQTKKKGPVRTVQISCLQCKAPIFKYRKGGKGALVKCFIERIVEDHTTTVCHCPGCGQEFARETMIRGAPAYKMIGGKVHMK
ncbi:hypothetical protein IT774_09270 [Salinimonas marina]|uniref:Zn-ribbon motif protein n=1 Tax=Salinimonas marina TaxID=2785918 RepID=A0A7S9E086_9ALTE|nr:hypothetical protein IT774_09270 [Salinimonas marina]